MKLIIEIPEEDYKFIKELQGLIIGGRGNCKTIQKNVINAIRNGTPHEERSPGEWEDYSVNFYKCPECGYLLNKFCPSCYNEVILPTGGADEPQ